MLENIRDYFKFDDNYVKTTRLPSMPIIDDKSDFVSNVTIAIPVYERTEFFHEALSSSINQTVKCKIIVIDNASSHNYFKDYITKLGNPDIKYYRNNENIGMVGNWNRCIQLCESSYISILHDDDVLHPQFIEFAVSKMGKNCEVLSVKYIIGENVSESFLSSDLLRFSEPYKYITPKDFILGNFIAFPGVIFPKKLALMLGGFNDYYFPCSDYDFWIRLSDNVKFLRSLRPMAFYRTWNKQNTNHLYPIMIVKQFEVAKKISIYNNLFFKYLFYHQLYLADKHLRDKLVNVEQIDKVYDSKFPFFRTFIFIDNICKHKYIGFIYRLIIFALLTCVRKIFTLHNRKSGGK